MSLNARHIQSVNNDLQATLLVIEQVAGLEDRRDEEARTTSSFQADPIAGSAEFTASDSRKTIENGNPQ
jgi:hypothetical protein